MKKYLIDREEVSFKQLFPQVEKLSFDGREDGDFPTFSFRNKDTIGLLHYDESTLPGELRCSNPKCQQGGYVIQWMIDSLIRKKDKAYEGSISCNGHEGTPKGRKIGDSCCNYIKFKMNISYKS